MSAQPRLPAEWEPQAGVMLTWPHEGTDWADQLPQVEAVLLRIAAAVIRDERLLCVCRDNSHQRHIKALFRGRNLPVERIRFSCAPSDDSWARDHGPLGTLEAGQAVVNDFRFDGWGGRYPASRDNAITASLHAQGCFGDAPLRQHRLTLEGGAIETDGLGTLLATRSSLLDRRRNPSLDPVEIERCLRDTLGLKRCLWLDHGAISGDDTDAHIDILARFTDPETIVHASAPPEDPDHPALMAMAEQLAGFRRADGHPYRLRPLPWPGEHRDTDGRRLPASYANFLITNGSVLMPTYGVAADAEAIALIQDCFPGRRVVPIDCRPLIRQNGSLHCLTMQFPAALPLRPGHCKEPAVP